MTDNFSIYEVA